MNSTARFGPVPLLLMATLSGWISCGSPSRFNIVLISIDTLRADHLTFYAYDRDTSPTLARLARQSIVFDQAFSQSPKTAPSHMTIFTGLYPSVHRIENLAVQNRRLSGEIPTLATLLSDAGYRTEAIAGGGNVSAELGFDQGFDTFVGSPDAPDLFRQADSALVRLAGGEEPFLLFLHTYEVHDPYTPEGDYAQLYADPAYDGRIVSSREELDRLAGGSEYWQQYNAYWSRVDPTSPTDAQHLRDLYDAEIRYTDQLMAGFLERFSQLGLEENTILVVLSDHGEEFFEHGSALHNTLYQEVLQVPLVFRLPAAMNLEQGRRIRQVVRLIDMTPTLLAAVEVPVPDHLQGDSLLPLLAGEDEESRPVFSERIRGQRRVALQMGKWKYIRQPDREELYDLSVDAGEKRNVANQNEQVIREFRRRAGQQLALNEDLAGQLQQGEVFELDEATRDQLEALGYLGEP